MSAVPSAPAPAAPERTKTRLLELLKQQRCHTVQALADELGVSVPAARRHLADLTEAGLVEPSTEKPFGRGRPQNVYRLTERGEASFPKRYASLCVDVLEHVQALFGEGAVLQVMDARRAQLAREWAPLLQGDLPEKLTRLAQLLCDAGYAARATFENGHWYLIEGNCPNLTVARRYGELCAAELDLYRELLGVPVTRETRIACAAPSCRYRIG
ncbi:helix-turn-helix transcriptional regulator [Deinococcus maricopensis]|uniref:Putative transcriptional regulator n=1 Tax=Deinococcus maricopensis (strain DSM 21211 / LMG 22137 / NRRL B-23946 / LB-34) TaxID=709986 RepID=E8U896_DEIML|nr:metalloregulator ArsR/SmtB family transcription factor [Deinococcus maricopensis]ADV67285.1 putative transcriptional regulator [Deinococcus maricopensis DSM 21211]